MADITIYDASGTEVFNSDDGPGMGEEFLATHPGESFKVVIKNQISGMTFHADMTAIKDEPSG